MNPGMQFILLIAFGVTHLSAVLGSKAIKQCYLTSYVGGTKCPDYPARITCLEKIDTQNDVEENMVEDAVLVTKSHRDKCKDWKVACMNDRKNRCEVFGACDDITVAQDCQSIINTICDAKYSDDFILADEFHSSFCDDGHFSDGPCSLNAIKNCTSKVIVDRGYPYAPTYNCQAGLIKDAEKCLAGLKTNCHTKAMHLEVDGTSLKINQECKRD